MAAAAPAAPGGLCFRDVGKVLVEDDAAGRQPVQGRGADPLIAVAAGVAEVEAAHADDENFHAFIVGTPSMRWYHKPGDPPSPGTRPCPPPPSPRPFLHLLSP